jgi:hypothetical protein
VLNSLGELLNVPICHTICGAADALGEVLSMDAREMEIDKKSF